MRESIGNQLRQFAVQGYSIARHADRLQTIHTELIEPACVVVGIVNVEKLGQTAGAATDLQCQ